LLYIEFMLVLGPVAPKAICSSVDSVECTGNYSATSNDMKLVHWPLIAL